VVAEVTLPQAEFDHLCDNLLDDRDYIEQRTHLCGVDIYGVWHVLAFTSEQSNFILITESSGYGYCRYSGIISKGGDTV